MSSLRVASRRAPSLCAAFSRAGVLFSLGRCTGVGPLRSGVTAAEVCTERGGTGLIGLAECWKTHCPAEICIARMSCARRAGAGFPAVRGVYVSVLSHWWFVGYSVGTHRLPGTTHNHGLRSVAAALLVLCVAVTRKSKPLLTRITRHKTGHTSEPV